MLVYMLNYKERLLKINTFIFDYDGVLTDGTVILMSNGEALRTANVKDGYALQLAMKKGYRIAIISGAYSESVKKRFESLRVSDVFLGVERKIEVFDGYLEEC
jgi:3-deoxy-D-manno-octulosonate 8-phosphate phosphatase (KDO 8-P phosphatase)